MIPWRFDVENMPMEDDFSTWYLCHHADTPEGYAVVQWNGVDFCDDGGFEGDATDFDAWVPINAPEVAPMAGQPTPENGTCRNLATSQPAGQDDQPGPVNQSSPLTSDRTDEMLDEIAEGRVFPDV